MEYNPYALTGKTILVTGASSGIGRAVAIECSRLGAHVILSARNKEKLEETLKMMEGHGHQVIECDLSKEKEVSLLIDEVPEIQGLVNTAGTTMTVPVPFIKFNVLSDLLKVNTIAPIMILSGLVKKKKLRANSSVVFTSSVSGLGRVSPGNTMYAATKGAVSTFVMGAAKELASKGIRVNAVCPGMTETDIMSHLAASEEQLEEDRKTFPLKRYGKPEEIAWAIIYLLSDASAWVTGTNLLIDGGRCLK